MGLFSIFSGKKNKEDKPKDSKPEKLSFDTALGHFIYVCSPGCVPPEYGYESEIDWPGADYEDRLGVYIDCESPESTDASRCYEKLERIVSEKDRTEYRVKSALAEHFLNEKPQLICSEPGKTVTKEDLIKEMKLQFISIYRNGDTVFSVYDGFCFDLRSEEIEVIFKADGSMEFKYCEYD
ncbi:MAG: DUF2262 domain-containing protein [Ruminococcus sp.]|nr:DUF2262 domain-containing protein [Ruminococcus sp.]